MEPKLAPAAAAASGLPTLYPPSVPPPPQGSSRWRTSRPSEWTAYRSSRSEGGAPACASAWPAGAEGSPRRGRKHAATESLPARQQQQHRLMPQPTALNSEAGKRRGRRTAAHGAVRVPACWTSAARKRKPRGAVPATHLARHALPACCHTGLKKLTAKAGGREGGGPALPQ